MALYIGIDLGTTFSAVSQLDNTGRANIVHNLDGDNITPSVVRFNSANESDVGVEPKKFLGLGFKDIFSRFKRDMGQEIEYETSFGNKVSPRDLSALVLKKLVQDTEETIGKIDSAVITVPANFPNNAREDTLNAGKQVGLNISNIINEPTAAAIYYAKNTGESLHGNICVFDLGGGTFDVSILKIEGNDINVIGSEGVFNLGGTDFDQKIYDLILSKVNQNTFDNNEFTLNDAEDLKRTLSKRKEAIARVGGRNIKITIEEFEDSIKGYLNQIETMCSIVMEEIDLNPTDINKVILAGGSTRMPCIKNGINKIFKQEPESFKNPDELVALGAALYSAYTADKSLLNPMQKSSVDSISLVEMTTKFFGTLVITKNEKTQKTELENSIIIAKGQKIPTSNTETYRTLYDGQDEIDCSVTESNSHETDPNFVKIIHEESLELPGDRPAGQPIEVTYQYDSNQMMNCQFYDVKSGRKKEIKLNVERNEKLDNEGIDIDEFIVE